MTDKIGVMRYMDRANVSMCHEPKRSLIVITFRTAIDSDHMLASKQ